MPILDPNAKAAYLAHYCKQNGVDPIDAATIGDGANNLAMLQATGMGVAFEGKPLLLAKVAIQLNHTDLRGLIYLQGYKEHDFIAKKI
jgi:phosphoserine phosphatase